jgi:hypothetical protein
MLAAKTLKRKALAAVSIVLSLQMAPLWLNWIPVGELGKKLEGVAFAAKKKKLSEAKLKKALEPLLPQVQKLWLKQQANGLFTFKDQKALEALLSQWSEMLESAPKSALLWRPTYQLAVLLDKRDRAEEAYELYTWVQSESQNKTLALLAKKRILSLEKQHPENLGSGELSLASATNGKS